MSGTIVDRLRNKSRVCIDSMTVIYLIERHPTYLPIVRPLFELVHRGEVMGLSSYITLLEVLVRPLKEGRGDLARQYRDILVRSESFRLFPVERSIAEEGAEIRARYAVPVPDAIQLATARQASWSWTTSSGLDVPTIKWLRKASWATPTPSPGVARTLRPHLEHEDRG